MVPRGEIPPEACAVLPRKRSHRSFPHKDHVGALISKEDQLLCWIFPAREWEACQIHIYLHTFTYGHGVGIHYGRWVKPSPWNSWVSCRINAWFPWKILSLPMRKILSLPLCQRRSGKSFGAPFWCQSHPRGQPWPGKWLFCCVLHGYQTPNVFSPCQNILLWLRGETADRPRAGWNINNIPLFHSCAGNNAPEGTGLVNQSCIFLKSKNQRVRTQGGRNDQFLLNSKGIWALIL